MGCDMCGKEGELYETRIEGTLMSLCHACKGHGEVLRRLPTATETRQEKRRAEREAGGQAAHAPRGEVLLLVRQDFGPVIKRAREGRAMTQEQLAKRLRIKESRLHKYETGATRPDLETARLLERSLGITLVEQHVEEGGAAPSGTSGPVTIGDLLKRG